MKQAARRSGPQAPPPHPEQKQRDSGTRLTGPDRPANYYAPLPIGSDAFMPPLAPPPEPAPLTRKLLWVGVLGAGAGVVAGAIVLAFALRDPEPGPAEVGLSREQPKAAAPAASPAKSSKALRDVAAQAAGSLDRTLSDAPVAAAASPADAPSPPSATQAPTETAAAEPAAPAAKPQAATTAPERSARSARRSTSRNTERLPERPTRADVIAAMSRIQPKVKACFPTGHGMATADITVVGRTGRVTTAQISGQSGAIGSCIARAVRSAQFPKFSAESITIRYPMAH